nr:DNA methyltransferase [Mesorhizobium sp. B2-8-9]
MCPYFAMFPEEYVARQLLAFTRPGDLVLDPFCGRGTTILESALHSRRAIGTDVNLVAACVSGAKAEVPSLAEVLQRLDYLEVNCVADGLLVPEGEFFQYCFHTNTLEELLFLRAELRWREDPVDRFIAAVALGALHGEAHRSPNYLSNRMPRTISTKPEYSVRWWKERNLLPERRTVFPILRTLSRSRLSVPAPSGLAKVALQDARNCGEVFAEHQGEVRLMVTSPPYLDTTDYSEDQWLRIWFLGGPERPTRKMSLDDRHTNKENYWDFLAEVWKGTANLLGEEATIAIRIGGKGLDVEEISSDLSQSLAKGLSRDFRLLDAPKTTEIKNGQLNSFRPGALGKSHEHDFVFRLH